MSFPLLQPAKTRETVRHKIAASLLRMSYPFLCLPCSYVCETQVNFKTLTIIAQTIPKWKRQNPFFAFFYIKSYDSNYLSAAVSVLLIAFYFNGC